MIDTSNAKWSLSKEEKYVVKWFNESGFDGKLEKQYVSKTVFKISKDGINDKFELPQGIVFNSISDYMEMFKKDWEMICKINKDNNRDKDKHKYRILYYETYVDTYEIEATSEEEAKEILLKKIDSSEIDPPNTLVSSDYDVEEI